MIEFLFKLLLTQGIPTLWKNKGKLSLYWKTTFGKHRKEKIRFSISYLFRIKIPNTNSYLLVFNRRIANQLQPVGGVYKRYGDDQLFESWGYEADNNRNGIGTDGISHGDLRFRVWGKNVIKVIRWFEECREREVSAQREFHEELIETEILDKDLFRNISYRHLKRTSKHLKWSEHHQCYEVLIYDIMELLPNTEQQKFLIELSQDSKFKDGIYAIVDSEEIEQLRLVKDNVQIAKIGEHTKQLINQ